MECGRNGKSGGIWRETGLKPLNGFRLKGVLIDSPAHGEFLVFDCARPRALFFPPPAAIETSSEAGGIASGGYFFGVGVWYRYRGRFNSSGTLPVDVLDGGT